MKAALVGLAAISLSAVLLAAAPGHAQAPPAPLPAPGFMPPYEVTKMIRASGFEPLAPPLREGTTYVLRATDFRGILMRVVVDARSGAIRAVNRIVPGPGPYGPVGMVAAPYGMPPPNGVPPDAAGPGLSQEEAALGPPASPASYPGSHPSDAGPPLPRPRPAELAARDAKAAAKPAVLPAVNAVEVPAAKPEPKPSTTASTPSPSPPPAAPKRPPAPAIPD